jgi:hypothetical protein
VTQDGPLLLADLVDDDDHDHDEEYDRHSVPGRTQGATLTEQGWYAWHAPYDDLVSEQSDRLQFVQDMLVDFFDHAPAGRLRAVSVCSGQSRDLLPILIHHPRGAETRATMLELDPLNASFLHGALGSTALTDVEVVVTDAGLSDAYVGIAPVDLVLLCGVFANVGPADAGRTVDLLSALCAPGGLVVWTSYGAGMADADAVVDRLESGPFARVALVRTASFVVGAHRFSGETAPLPVGERVFTFRPA